MRLNENLFLSMVTSRNVHFCQDSSFVLNLLAVRVAFKCTEFRITGYSHADIHEMKRGDVN